LSKSNCRILQFLHQMFNVSALPLDDALLKYVVTELVVLFSIAGFSTQTFHKVVHVATHLRFGGIFGDSIITIFSWFWQWKKFENRSIFYEVKGKA